MEKRKIEVYIDGSSVDVNAKKRPKGTEPVFPEWHGAYAGVFYVDGQEVMRMKGYEKGGTIGKMELSALLNAMRKVYQMNYSQVSIFGDSQYVINGATKWLKGWEKKRFKGIKFPELWREIDIMLKNSVTVYEIKWIRGHNGSVGNEIADKLANEALGAGITGWKVSGKERFLLFDKVECFENAVSDGFGFIHEEAGPFPVITEEMNNSPFLNKSEIFTLDDNDFTDMAKKKPEKTVVPAREKVYPTWYEEQIAKHKELIKKQTEEFNQMMDRYAKHVEEIIYELKIEKEKQDGTRSTKSNP